jgi:hypothetical protein
MVLAIIYLADIHSLTWNLYIFKLFPLFFRLFSAPAYILGMGESQSDELKRDKIEKKVFSWPS